jgi:soluble lytic murein transglycosylase-like protein
MSNVIDPTSTEHRMLWVMSVLLGVCLLLRTSDLQSELVSIPRSPAPPLLALMCEIPARVAPEIKALSRDIARRFHLAEGAAASITHAAFSAARVRGIDPTLVLAVAAVESKFKPRAVNQATGAKGLMQVMPKWHQDKVLGVGGEPSLLLIAPNINVGAAILAEYLEAEDGNIEDALGHYLGTAGADHYLKLVRLEMAHLTRVVSRNRSVAAATAVAPSSRDTSLPSLPISTAPGL